jgi:hypothetical protein
LTSAEASRYVATVSQSAQQATFMHALRIPGRNRYLDELQAAVTAVLEDRQTPQQALDHAARRWSELSAELGDKSQLQAYQRSYR